MSTNRLSREPIAIVGMGCVYPNAPGVDAFWRLSLAADPSAQQLPPRERWDYKIYLGEGADQGYSALGGYIRDDLIARPGNVDDNEWRGCARVERWLRLALAECAAPVRRAGARERCVMGATAVAGSEAADMAASRFAQAVAGDEPQPGVERALLDALDGPFAAVARRQQRAILQSAVGSVLGPRVDTLIVDAACASSLFSVDHAVRALRSHSTDIVWAGGFFAWGPLGQVLFSKLNGLSRRRCTPFDKHADGTLFGDGVGVLALKRLSDALADGDRIQAIVRGCGGASDGRGRAVYAPNRSGQVRAMRRALEDATIDPAAIDFVCAHATGTPLGDTVEYESLLEVYGAASGADRRVALSSTKGLFGHLGWSAGVASVMQVALALREGVIPPLAGFEEASIDLARGPFFIPRAAAPFPSCGRPSRAAASGFGFGGTNAHLILERWEPSSPRVVSGGVPLPPPEAVAVAIVAWELALPGVAPGESALAALESGTVRQRFERPVPFAIVPMMASTLAATDPSQILVAHLTGLLVETLGGVVHDCRETAAVIAAQSGILGASVDVCERIFRDTFRRALAPFERLEPAVDARCAHLAQTVPEPSEDSFPGIMPSVIAGRVANVHDLRGINETIDDGDQSLHAAFRVARELLSASSCSLAFVVGASTGTSDTPLADYSEGAVAFALMREEDARRRSLPVHALLSTAPFSCSADASDAGPRLRGLAGAEAIARVAGGSLDFAVVGGADNALLVRRPGIDVPIPVAALAAYEDATYPLSPPPTVSSAEHRAMDQRRWHLAATSPQAAEQLRDRFGGGAQVPVVCDTELRDEPLLELPGDTDATVVHTLVLAVDLRDEREPLPRHLHVSWLRTYVWAARMQSRGLTAAVAFLCMHDASPGAELHPFCGLGEGLIGTWRREYPRGTGVVVGLGPRLPQELAGVIEEQLASGADTVAFRDDGARLGRAVTKRPLLSPVRRSTLGSAAVLVGFGCASGVGSQLVLEWAARSGCRVVLASRSARKVDPWWPGPLPSLSEYLSAPALGGQRIADRVREHRRLEATRERSRLIAKLHALGIEVELATCDVTEPEQVQRVVDSCLARYGRIDAIVHAAIDIGSHVETVVNYSWDRLTRGLSPKIDGTLELGRVSARCQQILLVGSIASFGMPGLTGYSAANAFQSRMAAWFWSRGDRRWRVHGWPAWADVGMVSQHGALREAIEARGLASVLSNEQGRALFGMLDGAARQPHARYLLGETDIASTEVRVTRERPAAQPCSPDFPFLDTVLDRSDTKLRAARVLDADTDRDSWLNQHTFRGVAVLPGTCLIEMAVEAGRLLIDGRQPVVAIEDAEFLHFVKVHPGRPVVLDVHAQIVRSGSQTEVAIEVRRDLTAPSGRSLVEGHLHFRCRVLFGPRSEGVAALDVPPRERRWRAVDPYTEPGGSLRLAGLFDSTTDTEAFASGACAVFRKHVATDHAVFSRTAFAPVLLDGALRVIALRSNPRGQRPLFVPQRIHRIEVFSSVTDAELSASTEEEIRIVYREPDDRHACGLWEVVGSQRGILYRVQGIEGREIEARAWKEAGPLPYYVDRVTGRGDDWVRTESELSLEREAYLATAARLNGVAVLPVSFQMEIGAQVSKLLRPGASVMEVSNVECIQVLKLFPARVRTLCTHARVLEETDERLRIECRVSSRSPVAGIDGEVVHSTFRMTLGRGPMATSLPSLPSPLPFDDEWAREEPAVPAVLYYRRSPLRLGQGFAAVWDTISDGTTRRSTYVNSCPLHHDAFQAHVLPPLLLDAALQGCLRRQGDLLAVGIPRWIGSVRIARELNDLSLRHRRLRIETTETEAGATPVYEVRVVDCETSEVLIAVSGFDCVPLGFMHPATGLTVPGPSLPPLRYPPTELVAALPEFAAVAPRALGPRKNLSPDVVVALDEHSALQLRRLGTEVAILEWSGGELALPERRGAPTLVEAHLSLSELAAPGIAGCWSACEEALRRVYALGRALKPSSSRCVLIVRGAWAREDPRRAPRLQPAAGIVLGFVKSLAKERPARGTRLWLCDDVPVQWARGLVQREDWGAEPSAIERFVKDGRELEVRYREVPGSSPGAVSTLRNSDVVLITGGAGGLGARTARAIHRRFGCRLVLVGRSAPSTEKFEFGSFAEFLVARGAPGGAESVADRRREYERKLSSERARAAVSELRSEGADVRYLVCDITDRDAVERLAADVRRDLGSLDVVIHAAGTQRAARLESKSWAEVRDRVAVKVLGALHLIGALESAPPRLWLHFGSNLVVDGMAGEADYTAANACLESIGAAQIAEERASVARTLHWCPWVETGLAARQAELLDGLSETDLGVIYPDEGEEWLLKELAGGRPPASVTVVRARRDSSKERRKSPRKVHAAHSLVPALDLDELRVLGPGHVRGTRIFDLSRDPDVRGHLVRGEPCLSGAHEIVLALEPLRVFGRLYLHELRDIRYVRFLKLRGGLPLAVTADVRVVDCGWSRLVCHVRLLADVVHGRTGRCLESGKVHWEAQVVLGTTPPEPSNERPPSAMGLRPLRVPHYVAGAPIYYAHPWRTLRQRYVAVDGATWGEVEVPENPLRQIPAIGDALALTSAFTRHDELMVHVNFHTESVRFRMPIILGETVRNHTAQCYGAPLVAASADTYVSERMLMVIDGGIGAEVRNATFASYGWIRSAGTDDAIATPA